MLPANSQTLVETIHAAGRPFVLALTGGGSEAIAALLRVPGASASVLEAVVPYGEAALARLLGGKPDHYCSAETARAMAMAAYRRACDDRPGHGALAGVALTGSLASNRPKRGAHRLHAAWQTADTTTAVSVELVSGRRTRAAEEDVAATLVLNLVAEACGLPGRLPLELGIDEPLVRSGCLAPTAWQRLLAGEADLVRAAGAADGSETETLPAPRLVFPGAFHPLHAGHRRMAEVAAELCGTPAAFELSMFNVDKPPLDFLELRERVAQFAPGETLLLTRALRFAEKARLLAGCTFIVGADTIARIGAERYYGGSRSAAQAAIESIAAAGCRFLVFGRVIDGQFRELADLELPGELRAISQAIDGASFRHDISSSELRKADRAQPGDSAGSQSRPTRAPQQ